MESGQSMAVVACPHCHQPHSLSWSQVGKKVTCQVCRKPFVAKREDPKELDIEIEMEATYGSIECPKCVSEIPISDAVAGKNSQCAVCGFSFLVPVATGPQDEVWLEQVREAAIAQSASIEEPIDPQSVVPQAVPIAAIIAPVATGLVVLLVGLIYFGFLGGIAYLAGLGASVVLAEVCRRGVSKALERNKVRVSGPVRSDGSSIHIDKRQSP